MVVTVFWMQSWISLTLAVVSLFILVFFIFFCTCFERKKKSTQFYTIDEKGIKREQSKNECGISTCNLNVFKRFSGTTETENMFTSKNLPFYALKTENKLESDLIDSTDVSKSFNNLVLKFDGSDVPLTSRDELQSCISAESLNSFYSAHPSNVTRGNSKESFVSLISESEGDNSIV